jgi:aspartyl-tRNA(Asn)/glutamyl-tRNA(Gln) amidotransferase subunit C
LHLITVSIDIIIDMKLSLTEVEHIAELARLQLTQEEKERYRQQLSAILDYAARLQQVDTSNIPPTSSVLPPRSVLRRDEAATFENREDLLDNAPQSESDQFRVPPVME